MTTVTIDEELQTRVQAVAPDEDLNGLVRAALQDYVERRERLATKQAAARAEIEAALNGPRRTLAESHAEFRRKHNTPDLSHLTRDELAEDAERIIAAMDPQARAQMEREGLL